MCSFVAVRGVGGSRFGSVPDLGAATMAARGRSRLCTGKEPRGGPSDTFADRQAGECRVCVCDPRAVAVTDGQIRELALGGRKQRSVLVIVLLHGCSAAQGRLLGARGRPIRVSDSLVRSCSRQGRGVDSAWTARESLLTCPEAFASTQSARSDNRGRDAAPAPRVRPKQLQVTTPSRTAPPCRPDARLLKSLATGRTAV